MRMPLTSWKSRSCRAAWPTASPGPMPSARLRPPSASGSKLSWKTASKSPCLVDVWSMPDRCSPFDTPFCILHSDLCLLTAALGQPAITISSPASGCITHSTWPNPRRRQGQTSVAAAAWLGPPCGPPQLLLPGHPSPPEAFGVGIDVALKLCL